MALNESEAPVSLHSISERRNISVSYLEQLFGKLRRQSLVKSVRGPGGGYYLAVPGSLISIAEIIMAVDDSPDATNYEANDGSQSELACSADLLWGRLDETWYSYLSTISLQQLVDLHRQDKTEATPVTASKHARGGKPTTPPRTSQNSRGRITETLAS